MIMDTSAYQNHLKEQYNSLTFKRKIDYLRYNFGSIFKKVSLKRGSILEIGPGMGESIGYLNSLGIYNIDIVDSDKQILQDITNKFKIKRAFINTNVCSIDKKLGRYDLIILIQVLEHMSIDILPKVIKVLFSHLNKNGQIIIVVPNAGNPLGLTERYGDLQHTISFTERSLKDLIELSNIKNYSLKLESFKIPPYETINIVRIVMQKLLHLFLLLIMIVNGGSYFKIMTPNIVLKLKKC